MNTKTFPAFCLVLSACAAATWASDFYVAPLGSDASPGTKDKPFATIARAQAAARQARGAGPVTVHLRGGTYYLPETIVFTAEDSGTKEAPIEYRSYEGETAVLSGGAKLDLVWEPFRDGILKAKAPAGLATDQLFVGGERQHLARYPNHDPKVRIYNGHSADAFSRERAARWADPRGGFIHAMHEAMWGGFHYIITGKDAKGDVTYEGGWQNNRPAGMHREFRFVENIFEELDAPGEWFLDAKTGTLYFLPPAGLDVASATVEAVRLRHLVEFRGTLENPVKFLTLRGLTFRHAARTFMENREPLLRSDWTTYRGGAVLFRGAEDCALEDSFLDQVGGNAVFVDGYNRRVAIRGCHIAKAGANGVALIGNPAAIRSASWWKDHRKLDEIDREPGPRSPDYPADCLVEDCLIHETGRVEKQTAPVQIQMAQGIVVRRCSLYDVPRAGINIGDGCWGGNTIEFCDIFDTVKETGDHGSFNSWGRDRYWGLEGVDLNSVTLGENRGLPLLDMVKPTVIKNNRWRCDHGWDIDLDDGSSNYEIRENLCLNGGIKLREGFYRICENNVMVNNSFHPHVWYKNSQDVFRRNIVFGPYQPIGVHKPWGKECDFNLLHKRGAAQPAPAKGLQDQSGLDAGSIEADALFVDPERGDFRVRDGSPALALGFRNFPMDSFGVRKPELRAIARTPRLPSGKDAPAGPTSARDGRRVEWLGAKIKNVTGLGEVSAAGLSGEIGVRVAEAPDGSGAAKAGLREGDVILGCEGKETKEIEDFLRAWRAAPGGRQVALDVFRAQARVQIRFMKPADTAAPPFPLRGWRFTTERPPAGWEREGFDDSRWKEGEPGFGNQGLPPLQQAKVKTPWNEPEIWTRARLDLDAIPERLAMRWSHDEDAEVYVNGVLVAAAKGFIVGYENVPLDGKAREALRAGKNIVAAHCRQTVGGQFLDVGFVETKAPERRSVESILAELGPVPRPEHPRPDRLRPRWLNLNGAWEFAFDPEDRGLGEGWSDGRPLTGSIVGSSAGRIVVPFAPESLLSGVHDEGLHLVAWYARSFDLPGDLRGRRVLLHFGAVDYRAEVWLNGRRLGAHEGGYNPFEFDVTHLLRPEGNRLTVRAHDDPQEPKPHGKQCPERFPRGDLEHSRRRLAPQVALPEGGGSSTPRPSPGARPSPGRCGSPTHRRSW